MPTDDLLVRSRYSGLIGRGKRALRKTYRYWAGRSEPFRKIRKSLGRPPRPYGSGHVLKPGEKIPIKSVEKLRRTQEEKKRRLKDINKR